MIADYFASHRAAIIFATPSLRQILLRHWFASFAADSCRWLADCFHLRCCLLPFRHITPLMPPLFAYAIIFFFHFLFSPIFEHSLRQPISRDFTAIIARLRRAAYAAATPRHYAIMSAATPMPYLALAFSDIFVSFRHFRRWYATFYELTPPPLRHLLMPPLRCAAAD